MTDSTSNIIFPYMQANFNGREFLKNRDNFALKKHIKSIKIFEMQNTSFAESNIDFTLDSANSANIVDSANRGGAI